MFFILDSSVAGSHDEVFQEFESFKKTNEKKNDSIFSPLFTTSLIDAQF